MIISTFKIIKLKKRGVEGTHMIENTIVEYTIVKYNRRVSVNLIIFPVTIYKRNFLQLLEILFAVLLIRKK